MSLVVFALIAAAGFWVLRASIPPVTPAPRKDGALPRVSIIVPARDEAHNLPALLASLRALDPPAHEIIVVDDHSKDATAAIAAAAGATVITPPALPEGWRGKCWACQAGAVVASGEVLLFTDADTVHGPDSLARAAGALVAERADLVTAVPTHRLVAPWERLQAVFQLLLLVATSGVRHYAIGQYLMFRRDAYDRLGRHEPVRQYIAEDLAFAARLDAQGGKRVVLAAPGLVAVRMYPEGFGGFFRGWTRNFRDGLPAAAGKGALAVTVVIAWLLGGPLWLAASLAAGNLTAAGLAGASYALAVITIARRQRVLGDFSAASALAYPVFVVIFAAVTVVSGLSALARRPVTWRGRRFKLAGR